jgi:hypothetical protein
MGKVSSGTTTTTTSIAALVADAAAANNNNNNNNNNNKEVVVRHATFITVGWGGGNLDQKFTLVTLPGLCLLILVKVDWRQD